MWVVLMVKVVALVQVFVVIHVVYGVGGAEYPTRYSCHVFYPVLVVAMMVVFIVIPVLVTGAAVVNNCSSECWRWTKVLAIPSWLWHMS